MFTSPALLVGSVMATLWAALFQLFFGRRLIDLVRNWFVGLVGFGVGQVTADALGFTWLMVGQVHVAEGTLACWVAMVVAYWLKL